ncbi:MAG: glycan-binding surface protein [Bacteroidales bacterium]|jgi:hypothetical protein|nr:glycan-binding surface protein [Bacteroidales bacterium]
MIKKYIISLTAMFLLAGAFTSCKKDKIDDNMPVVKYVRPIDSDAADQLLTSVDMGATVAIVGEHLGNVTEVWFNDRKAKLNPNMVSPTNIIVVVPDEMPSVISDTITLITASGKVCKFALGLNIPAPDVAEISCEWAKDGDEVIIRGRYFFNVSEVLFAGNLRGEIVSSTETSVTVIVPDGTLSGAITVTSIYGTGRSKFTFRDATGIFIDGEDPAAWNWWGRSDFGTDGGLNGQYVWLHGTGGSWSWPADQLQLLYFSGGKTLIPAEENPENYALRFEYKVENWKQPNMYMWFTAAEDANIDADNACQYLWEPYKIDDAVTNLQMSNWATATIPLSEFNVNKSTGSTNMHYTSSAQIVNFNCFVFGDAAESLPIDIKMDNLRLVKIK